MSAAMLVRRDATLAFALIAFASRPVQLAAAGGCPGSSAACQASDEEVSGAVGLLQLDASRRAPSRESAAGAGSRSGSEGREVGSGSAAAASLLGFRSLQEPGVLAETNCTATPTLCEAPFNCHSNPPTLQDLVRWDVAGLATRDGHANLKTWCLAPKYEDTLIKNCLKNHDLKTSAQAVFNWTVANGIDQLDGSYCFMEGHCTNMDVTYDTTVEEAEALCDAKYGHHSWMSVKLADEVTLENRNPSGRSKATGFHTRDWSSFYGRLACAMGNFHCDVIYCRDTYCKKPEYVEKYGHYLKDFGYSS